MSPRRPLHTASVLLLALAPAACTLDSTTPDGAVADVEEAAAAARCTAGPPSEDLDFLLGVLHEELAKVVESGALDRGRARALSRHLENASRQFERGQMCAVQAQIEAFRKQLEKFAESEGLSDRDLFELRLRSRMASTEDVPGEPGGEEYAPGVTGELRSVMLEGDEIVYRVIDGLAIVGGDMILGFADEVEAAAGGGMIATSRAPCVQTEISCGWWEDGVVGFDYFPDWGSEDTPRMIELIVQAVEIWREQTGIEFERRTSGPRIVFRNGDSCSSWVGRNPFAIFDPQYVFLNRRDCDDVGVIAHEIGHAVGLWHEQMRNDREHFIQINYDAIIDEKESNFFKCLALCIAFGDYAYESLMHYGCRTFRNGDATRDPIVPLRDGITCDMLRQRERLHESDIGAVYRLYRPTFSIGGARDGETSDRFVLTADFETEPVADEWLRWLVDGEFVANGQTFSTAEHGVANGFHTVTAEVRIWDRVLASDETRIRIANLPPTVDLGPDRTVDMNRTFTVRSDVFDAEDGDCPTPVCTYTWSPEPELYRGGAADFRFTEEGEYTISVTVADGSGATATDEMVVAVVDSPPVVTILEPAGAITVNEGAEIALSGFATDVNGGPGPEPGVLPCYYLVWSSSDPSDRVTDYNSCETSVVVGSAGTRTISLQVGAPATAISTVQVTVEACGANCAPDVEFEIVEAPDFDDSTYESSFTEPGYYLSSPLTLRATIDDQDVPRDNPMRYRYTVRPFCIGSGCPDIVVSEGDVAAPSVFERAWTPSVSVAEWTTCVTVPLPAALTLTVTDSRGASRSVVRTIYLGCVLR